MMKPYGYEDPGATPGVPYCPLTRDPLGTSGELSAGPDHLRPEVPAEREELIRMGYLPDPDDEPRELADLGVMDDAWGDILPRLPKW